jgi:predicted O-linked N-acetylglucosamine transferase (SPINDLY family)
LSNWDEFESQISQVEIDISLSKKLSLTFHLLGLIDRPDLHLIAAQTYAASECPSDTSLGPIAHRPFDGKIRIGYYSADFHNHATAFLMAELFELHDKSKFEFYAFSFGPNINDDMRKRLSLSFHQFIDVTNTSDRDVAILSRQIGIDIAVDLKGYTQDSRANIFAKRCAPIQVSYLGYPGTMGVDYMDYIIADKVVIPEANQHFFTEKVVYLPNSYQVNDSKRVISDRVFSRNEVGIPENSFVFCCFNNNYKILPATFDIWMRILQSVPNSVLWLLDDNPTATSNLFKEAESRGVAGDRLIFAKRIRLDEHLARHRLADLFLDTLPYNAHTTTSDALWAGLPVLTCTGQSFASRVAASLLEAIGLPEMITHHAHDYEQKAIEIARNLPLLEQIKSKLASNRLSTPLFNTQLFTQHIEAAYSEMFQRYQNLLPPQHIYL